MAVFGFGVGDNLADVGLAGFGGRFVFGIEDGVGISVFVVKHHVDLQLQVAVGTDVHEFLGFELPRRRQVLPVIPGTTRSARATQKR